MKNLKSFDVLDRNLNLYKHTLIEASAGTGKTFSIEHLVVRFLIEGQLLQEIVVVTFTRAATSDLKSRIQSNIKKALFDLHQKETAFDYLRAVLEKGEKAVNECKDRLERALFSFDLAQIFTIHRFCLKMLTDYGFKANLVIEMPKSENPLPNSEVLQMIHDYFRTEFSKFRLSQIQIILKRFQNSILKLETFLLRIIVDAKEIGDAPKDSELFSQFLNVMSKLKCFAFDFEKESVHFNKLCKKNGEMKPEVRKKLEEFQSLIEKKSYDEEDFDWFLYDQLSVLDFFDKKNLKSKGEDCQREFFQTLKKELKPLISDRLFVAKLASDCHRHIKNCLNQMEKFRFDDLLSMMHTALKFPQFMQAVRAQYKTAIIDEFQDTDPLQWNIFRKIFLTDDKFLYLVGDPKQSIYAFRQADIYTYLDAAKSLGQENQASLNTNYRSQAPLIHALNAIFSDTSFLALPKFGTHLFYRTALPAPNAPYSSFKDGKEALHFPIIEIKNYSMESIEKMELFPFIAREIQHLRVNEGIEYDQIAVLVADRFQAGRLSQFLKQFDIPNCNQRQQSLIDSIAYSSLKELIESVLNPQDIMAIKRTLGGNVFGLTHLDVIELDQVEILELFCGFHVLLIKEGFASFFQKIMQFQWEKKTLAERIISSENGEEFYRDIYQLAEILIVSEATCDDLLKNLDELKLWDFNDDERIKRRNSKANHAVSIMTLHSSKGLEFDIVFLPGLLKRSKRPDLFYPDTTNYQTVYKPILNEEDHNFQKHLQEIDAEKMRQLYVGMTRAKYRVYAPIILSEDIPELGEGSPMELFFQYISDRYQSLSCVTTSNLTSFQTEKNFSKIELNKESTNSSLLTLPAKISFQSKPERVGSFTSMKSQVKNGIIAETSFPNDFFVEEKTIHTLPTGSETGLLIHRLLENFSFSNQEINEGSYVSSYTEGTSYQRWTHVLSEMLYKAVNAPLIAGDQTLLLKNIHPNSMIKETEFLYKNQSESVAHIKGVIDLIVKDQNKYYLIDWKSNWLGPTVESYNRESMEKNMRENDYFFQSRLYCQALKKHLHLVEQEPFEKLFGGVFYVYVRGLSENNSSSGIYYFYPNNLK